MSVDSVSFGQKGMKLQFQWKYQIDNDRAKCVQE